MIELRKFDKLGNEMFTKQYPKNVADRLIKEHSTYPSGEKHWEIVPAKPKGRPKKSDDDSKE